MISVALFYHGDSLMAYCGQRRNDAFAPSVTLSCVNVLGLTFHTGIATALSSFLFDCKMCVGMLIRKVSLIQLFVPSWCVCACVQIQSAKEAVKTVLDHMTNPQTSTHLELQKGDAFSDFCQALPYR